MRNLALSIAAVLVLAVVSPAVAQPFADVPTDHWAFDAIAELAAKGVIEGYPDGTFKGDRGITRYEVAMIVARILARIEAIKIPGPAAPAAPPAAAPPAVTPAQVQTIQRLVNEFRAELAALGVRVTAVEEELAALKQAGTAGTVRVTGDSRLRYRMWATGEATGGTSSTPTVEWRHRLMFTAKPASNVTAFAQLHVGSTFGDLVTILESEYTYVDFPAFGATWRLGQQDGTLGNGLLFGGDPTGGLKANFSFAGFGLEAGGYTDLPGTTDYWVARVSMGLGGYDLGASYYSQRPVGGTESTGYGVDFSGSLFGLSLSADYASWTPAGAAAETAYKVAFDLGEMLGIGGLSVWYKSFGTDTAATVAPAHTAAATFSATEIFGDFAWNFKGWGVKFTTDLGPFSADLRYETGERVDQNDAVNVYYLGLSYPLAPSTSLLLTYRKQDGAGAVAGAQQETQYRVQIEVTY